MVLDSKIMRLREKFRILTVRDWSRITPAQVLATPDIGPQTLNHLRLHLAHHGITLSDDQTPTFWQSHLYETRIGTVEVSNQDRSIVCPFTIVIDAQEKYPFEFQGIVTDRDQRPLLIRTVTQSLGPTHGDYSMLGFDGECHIERKSIDDARGTILGWGDRREQFERTLEYLSGVWMAAIVVECSFGALINSAESRGKKSVAENRKILHRQVLAWQIDYTVPWIFCDDRRLAEKCAFRIMQRCYAKQVQFQKQSEKPKKENLENGQIEHSCT